jgi:HEAT repeat protein
VRTSACRRSKVDRRKPLLIELAQDASIEVRAAAFNAFSSFSEDPKIVELSFAALARDPSPDVQKACVRAVSSSHHYGHAERLFGAYQAAVRSPHPEVRQEVTQAISWLPDDRRIQGLVETLLADGSMEVRRRMARQSCNMADHPELAALFVRAATLDPSLEVRADALYGMPRLMPLGDAIALYRQRLTADPSEAVGYAVVNGLRDHLDDPNAKKLVQELATGGAYANVSRHAREVLSGS